MFISLTASDDGQLLDVRADAVLVVQVLDKSNTLVLVGGLGEGLVVKETPARVCEEVAKALGWPPAAPRLARPNYGRAW